jgi:phosphomannomutase
VMLTPAAAFLVTSEGCDAAFVISASHNPFPDNGIKVLTGDGDRAILVDDGGEVVDGDAMLFIFATHLKSKGALPWSAVVATVMSNIGGEIALGRAGIDVHRCSAESSRATSSSRSLTCSRLAMGY